ncbi:TetR/AcrR family transcriptional regulator [bacterium]|nr:MAG: TetR/AcrR family transcriptional regulator [bacterium]
MGKRGNELHDQILWAATDVFLEVGFERASMDVVAARAQTTKRTVYTRFENKEKLFLAVIEMVRGLVLDGLSYPAQYAADPIEAVTLYCARYLKLLRYQPAIQMCRVAIAEAARFPQGSAQHFDALFVEIHSRLGDYLQTSFNLSEEAATDTARRLLGQLLYPGLLQVLYGVAPLAKSYDSTAPLTESEVAPVRRDVEAMLKGL